jgi:hypothetical protein
VQPPEGDPEEGDPEQRRPCRDLSNCVWKRQGAYRIRALGTRGAYGQADGRAARPAPNFPAETDRVMFIRLLHEGKGK